MAEVLFGKEETCSVCKMSSCIEGNDILTFGEWMRKGDYTIHYFCLVRNRSISNIFNHLMIGLLKFIIEFLLLYYYIV